MEQISAAEQMMIEMGETRWRLISNGKSEPRILMEAASGQALSYRPDFASTRRLPKGGSLEIDHIQRIVLGWSASDESWHLGMMLESDLAQARGSRWCELARWPDPHMSTFDEIAQRAGRSLAHVMTRPFSQVPPRPVEVQPRELPPLPLSIDETWRLDRSGDGNLELVADKAWRRPTVRRIVWYCFWTLIYGLLIYGTVTSNIAPPNPEFLPALGVLSALLLIGLIFRNVYQLMTRPTHYIVDSTQQVLHAAHGKGTRWSLFDHELRSVYVTQVVGRRRKKSGPVYGELNLHLRHAKDNRFKFLMQAEDIVEFDAETDGDDEAVVELTTENYSTDLQAAALYIAQALHLPAMYDRRSN
jgi:hypothetical protein